MSSLELLPYGRQTGSYFEAFIADPSKRLQERRQHFVRALTERKPPEVVIGGGCHQIGKVTYDFAGSTRQSGVRSND